MRQEKQNTLSCINVLKGQAILNKTITALEGINLIGKEFTKKRHDEKSTANVDEDEIKQKLTVQFSLIKSFAYQKRIDIWHRQYLKRNFSGFQNDFFKNFNSYQIHSNINQEIDKLYEYCNYDNWDGYNAVAIDKIIIFRTKQTLGIIQPELLRNLTIDDLSPNPHGTITVRLEINENDIYIEIGKTKISIFGNFKDNTKAYMENISSESSFKKFINLLINECYEKE